MAAKVTIKQTGTLEKVAKSPAMAAKLEPFADAIFASLMQDPNKFFRATLRKKLFISSGRRGRVSWQIGAEPRIGARVQAKRGVFTRALGRAGL